MMTWNGRVPGATTRREKRTVAALGSGFCRSSGLDGAKYAAAPGFPRRVQLSLQPNTSMEIRPFCEAN